jgi:hypothetical protein
MGDKKILTNSEYIQKLKAQLDEANKALSLILQTKDHMANESKWVVYNTAHLRSIARKYLEKYKAVSGE